MQMLSPDQQLRIGFDPAAQDRLMAYFGREEDFTEERVNQFTRHLEGIQGYGLSAAEARGQMGLGSEFDNALWSDPYARAYAGSVRDRYGSFEAFRGSDEYRYAQGYIQEHGRDGLSSEEIQEMIRHILTVAPERTEEETEYERQDKIRRTNDAQNSLQRPSAETYELFDIIRSNIHLLSLAQLEDILGARQTRESDEGTIITPGEFREILQALKDLIPAIKDSATLSVLLDS
jgi:hypothetical protein